MRYQSTTRSPIVVADVAGYPVRQGLRFAHHEEPARLSRLYNVVPGAYGDIVVFVEGSPAPDLLAPMVGALAGVTDRVHVVHLGGGAGSVNIDRPGAAAHAVRQLPARRRDLPAEGRLGGPSGAQPARPGGGHPGRPPLLGDAARRVPAQRPPTWTCSSRPCASSARRVARGVAVTAERLLLQRSGEDLVLVSLARAGTPAGILLRRYLPRPRRRRRPALQHLDHPRPRHRRGGRGLAAPAARNRPVAVRGRLDGQGRHPARADGGRRRRPGRSRIPRSAPGSMTGWPSSPTPGGARRSGAPVTTSCCPAPASTPRCRASSAARCSTTR